MIVPTPDAPRTLPERSARRYAVGAEFVGPRRVSFRVWAPKRKRVAAHVLPLEASSFAVQGRNARSHAGPMRIGECRPAPRVVELEPEAHGYFAATVDDVEPGRCYGFRLDDDDRLYPDPASRHQPEGPAGLSQLVDPRSFAWTDDAWPGVAPHGQVLYELHVGTFTREGTWQAAAEQLRELRELGITVLEVMPIADFPGTFGWGYDGVLMFAPTRLYGEPDDFRRFVDRAHAEGLGVILDVVYNHFGNFDNYLAQFSDDYSSDRYQNEWASAVNFEGASGRPVRDYFVANARYWVEEFHVDGYRFDATQCVYDDSPTYILGEAVEAARAAAGGKHAYFIGENEPQDVVHLRSPRRRGSGLDALWNDDFHHAATVRLTNKNPAYYSDYLGTAEELVAAVRHGFLYQGQRSQWQAKPRGTPTAGFPAHAFVSFLQNHDQTANSGDGRRAHLSTSPGRYRAMTALWLLAPQTPLFFQGQEFGATTPFLFFADYSGEAAEAVAAGRRAFLAQFPALRMPEEQRLLPCPSARETFERCRLDFTERDKNKPLYDLHRDLLRLRREDPLFARQRADRIDGAALGPDALVLRYRGECGDAAEPTASDDRLVLVNFGTELLLCPAPQPLLAPPLGCGWQMLWSSDHPRYGADFTPPVETTAGWRIPGECAVVLKSVCAEEAPPPEPGRRTHAESQADAE